MNFDDFGHRIGALIDRHMAAFEEKNGFSPGKNEIVFADPMTDAAHALVREFGEETVPDDMLAFFSHVERVSLPDFWNGYFLGPASWTISIHEDESPRQIQLSEKVADVVMLGADGGGTMYGLVPSEGNAVYSMPQDRIQNGIYQPTRLGSWGFRQIAVSFSDFVSRFTVGLEEYVAGADTGPFHFR